MLRAIAHPIIRIGLERSLEKRHAHVRMLRINQSGMYIIRSLPERISDDLSTLSCTEPRGLANVTFARGTIERRPRCASEQFSCGGSRAY